MLHVDNHGQHATEPGTTDTVCAFPSHLITMAIAQACGVGSCTLEPDADRAEGRSHHVATSMHLVSF